MFLANFIQNELYKPECSPKSAELWLAVAAVVWPFMSRLLADYLDGGSRVGLPLNLLQQLVGVCLCSPAFVSRAGILLASKFTSSCA
jgi:hypothetical protein